MAAPQEQTHAVTMSEQIAAPPTIHVSQVATAVNIGEILVALGVTRLGFQVGAAPVPGIEWIQTIALGPGSAVVLRDMLNAALEQHESTYGPLPSDPNMRVSTSVAAVG